MTRSSRNEAPVTSYGGCNTISRTIRCCCSFCRCCSFSPFLPPLLCLSSPPSPFWSLRPRFRPRLVRPLAWLLARSYPNLWRCTYVFRGQHGSTMRFDTKLCICSTIGSLRALNSYLLLFLCGPSPRSRAQASTSLFCSRSSRAFAFPCRASCALLCTSSALVSSSTLLSSSLFLSPLSPSSPLFSSSFLLRLLLALLVRF